MRYTRLVRNAFNVLGVSPESSIKEIRAAYRALAVELHPDKNPGARSQEAAAKFKSITAAYEELKDEDSRFALRAEILGDMGNEAWKNQRETTQARAYGGDTTDVSDDFSRAEAKQTSKRKLRAMYAFESFIHPRVLFIAVPLLMLATYTVKSLLFGTPTDPQVTMIAAEEAVDAWFNPKTNRFETPAPWDEDFRKSGAAALKKVSKKLVTVSSPP
jgi:curved DNA-binding protein CbpA